MQITIACAKSTSRVQRQILPSPRLAWLIRRCMRTFYIDIVPHDRTSCRERSWNVAEMILGVNNEVLVLQGQTKKGTRTLHETLNPIRPTSSTQTTTARTKSSSSRGYDKCGKPTEKHQEFISGHVVVRAKTYIN